jgi:acyl carrier protein phosphodiesterase
VNYLAHAYLSFGDPEILTGNLISDFVKGKKKYDYPPRILNGIDLHRAIDSFTDDHEVTKSAARLFKPAYGLYSTALMDIIYDHFLALELSMEGQDQFNAYTIRIYEQLERHSHLLPATFKSLFPFMKHHNWLYNYQYAWGIEKSLAGLVHRAAYLSESATAFRIFNEKYEEFRDAYATFFPQLRDYSLKKFSDIH